MVLCCSNFSRGPHPGFICHAWTRNSAALGDEDWFCSEALEQDGSYKSFATATKVGWVKRATVVEGSGRQLQII